MNVLKNFAKVLTVVVSLAFVADAQAQVWGGIGDGRGGGGYRGQDQWQQVDEVHFTDGKTAIAIQNCKNARASDFRCNHPDYQCSACSEIQHSDHSSYVVYQLIRGGYNPGPGRPGDGWGPGRPGPGRPGDGWGPGRGTPERQFLQTFHFYDKKTAIAKQKCELERSRMVECRNASFECSPCTAESHTDHSQFDLYRIVYR